MPINTVISGNPDSLHATAAWLRGRLTGTINDTTVDVIRAREMSGTSWTGPAATAFGARMDHIRGGNDRLAGDTAKTAETFDQFAEALRTAQTRMGRVLDAAVGAGLHVATNIIFEPFPAPSCYADPALQAAANALHERLLAAYASASQDALVVVAALAAAGAAVSAVWREIVEKRYLLALEFLGKGAEKYTKAQISELETKTQALKTDPVASKWRSEPGISGQQLNTIKSDISDLKGDVNMFKLLDRTATAGSIAYDIAHGKPPIKSVVTNITGSAASSVAGTMLGRMLTARGLGIAAVAVLGTGGGVIVGAAAGVLADAAWDKMPKPVRDKIEQGAKDLFEAGKKAVDTWWNDMDNAADKVWRYLF